MRLGVLGAAVITVASTAMFCGQVSAPGTGSSASTVDAPHGMPQIDAAAVKSWRSHFAAYSALEKAAASDPAARTRLIEDRARAFLDFQRLRAAAAAEQFRSPRGNPVPRVVSSDLYLQIEPTAGATNNAPMGATQTFRSERRLDLSAAGDSAEIGAILDIRNAAAADRTLYLLSTTAADSAVHPIRRLDFRSQWSGKALSLARWPIPAGLRTSPDRTVVLKSAERGPVPDGTLEFYHAATEFALGPEVVRYTIHIAAAPEVTSGQAPKVFRRIVDTSHLAGSLDAIAWFSVPCRHEDALGWSDIDITTAKMTPAPARAGWACDFKTDETADAPLGIEMVRIETPYPGSPTLDPQPLDSATALSLGAPRP